jgi:hypothetical protein
MTIESDIRDILLADAAVSAEVGARVALNASGEQDVEPRVVITVQRTPDYGLDNTHLATLATFTLQVWAKTSVHANTVADKVTAALYAQGYLVSTRATGFDPDTELDAVVLTVEHILD